MNAPSRKSPPACDLAQAQARWQKAFAAGAGQAEPTAQPLRHRDQAAVHAADWSGAAYADSLGFPGEFPFTRGIYASMYRGRSWSQRQLIGLGVPEDYNSRVKEMLALGASALSFLPATRSSAATTPTRCRPNCWAPAAPWSTTWRHGRAPLTACPSATCPPR
jgi:methylmalonyl-CoA mutase N-terminal domain/subunit